MEMRWPLAKLKMSTGLWRHYTIQTDTMVPFRVDGGVKRALLNVDGNGKDYRVIWWW